MKHGLIVCFLLMALPLAAQKNKVPDWFFEHGENEVVGVSLPEMKDDREMAVNIAISQALMEYVYAEELGKTLKPRSIIESYTMAPGTKNGQMDTHFKTEINSEMIGSKELIFEVMDTYTNTAGEVFVRLRMDQGQKYTVSFALSHYTKHYKEESEDSHRSEMSLKSEMMVKLAGEQRVFTWMLVDNCSIEEVNDRSTTTRSSQVVSYEDANRNIRYTDERKSLWDPNPDPPFRYREAGEVASKKRGSEIVLDEFLSSCENGMYGACLSALVSAMADWRIDTPYGIQNNCLLAYVRYVEQPKQESVQKF